MEKVYEFKEGEIVNDGSMKDELLFLMCEEGVDYSTFEVWATILRDFSITITLQYPDRTESLT